MTIPRPKLTYAEAINALSTIESATDLMQKTSRSQEFNCERVGIDAREAQMAFEDVSDRIIGVKAALRRLRRQLETNQKNSEAA